jgi:hypothetical protein
MDEPPRHGRSPRLRATQQKTQLFRLTRSHAVGDSFGPLPDHPCDQPICDNLPLVATECDGSTRPSKQTVGGSSPPGGADPKKRRGYLSVLAQEVPAYQLVDVQVALDRWATEIADRSIEGIGVSGAHRHFESLSDLVAEGLGAKVGAVD